MVEPTKPIVIAVDGPAASGKGTLSSHLAAHFNYARLDTGLIYRALGLKALNDGADPNDKNKIVQIAIDLSFEDFEQEALRCENVGAVASIVSTIPEVRKVLLEYQRKFASSPPNGRLGAVLDGRDIGSIVCPNAQIKIFLIADAKIRAARRFKELQERGSKAIHSRILRDIKERDARDSMRSIAPLKPAKDAFVLDTSHLDAYEVLEAALDYISTQNRN